MFRGCALGGALYPQLVGGWHAVLGRTGQAVPPATLTPGAQAAGSSGSVVPTRTQQRASGCGQRPSPGQSHTLQKPRPSARLRAVLAASVPLIPGPSCSGLQGWAWWLGHGIWAIAAGGGCQAVVAGHGCWAWRMGRGCRALSHVQPSRYLPSS